MIIFSERINGMYRDVRKAINEKEKSVVQDLAKEQVAGGADVMDINLGPTKGDAAENFVWLAQTVAEVTDKPISLDSAKPDVLVAAVPKVKAALPDTKLIINSSTATPDSTTRPMPAEMENGMSRIHRAIMPPLQANGTPVKTRTASIMLRYVRYNRLKINARANGATTINRWRALIKFSNCPPHSMW